MSSVREINTGGDGGSAQVKIKKNYTISASYIESIEKKKLGDEDTIIWKSIFHPFFIHYIYKNSHAQAFRHCFSNFCAFSGASAETSLFPVSRRFPLNRRAEVSPECLSKYLDWIQIPLCTDQFYWATFHHIRPTIRPNLNHLKSSA